MVRAIAALADSMLARLVPQVTAAAIECDWVCGINNYCYACWYPSGVRYSRCRPLPPHCFP